ncbi:MAG: CBS domain-containing protein [Spirulinaceae cyanobacterium SM2_1_0]|nr:CBS domain-containing protein [Spirulinaceae cyanobacterium SM2_1_0]
MELILCHQTADFDTLGAAVGLSRRHPGARIVLAGGAHPGVRHFLALYRDEFALIERRSVDPAQIRHLHIVDAQRRDRLGPLADWLDLPQLQTVQIYDHHLESTCDLPYTQRQVEPVGATATLVAEQLQAVNRTLTVPEATVMALGIHVDTGSLSFPQTTARDARALAWLLEQGASCAEIAEYREQSLSPAVQQLLAIALEQYQSRDIDSGRLAWVLLETPDFVPGLSGLAEQLIELIDCQALLVAVQYRSQSDGTGRLTVIGRSRWPQVNLHSLFAPYGGGGHAQAAALSQRDVVGVEILAQLVAEFIAQVPPPLTARELMSSPVRTIRPDTSIGDAQRLLLRYGHSGLSVVDEQDQLVGIISRRDLDIALHHGFQHAPVKGYMSRNLKTIAPTTPLAAIESLMVTYDIGRLPVLEAGRLLGIVTRTDVLRQRQALDGQNSQAPPPLYAHCLRENPRSLITPALRQFLRQVAAAATRRGWHLYLVGGAVRDLLLQSEPLEAAGELAWAGDRPVLNLSDIDLVVDGFHRVAETGAGVELARELQKQYPQARLEVHGTFQTAALLWHRDAELGSLAVDIATARTEFYPYPAANPEVEASSIHQDLYRRDFTINALALRLTPPREGELLDFFGGRLDLRSRQIRVLHANSFIEDPTRIYRAVRFAVRLGFSLEAQTESSIRYAIASGVYAQLQASDRRAPALTTRLKNELKYILQAPYWRPALRLLADLDALVCLHPALALTPSLEWQLRGLDRALRRFDANRQVPSWQLRLELLVAALPPAERAPLAERLQLTAESIERLGKLAQAQATVTAELPQCDRPSAIVQLLQAYKLPLLVLLAVRSPRPIRRQLWRYLSHWSQVKAPLDGRDLQRLGYPPGPQYRQMLAELLAATLDGAFAADPADVEIIRDRAEAFLRKRYKVGTMS